MGRKKYVVEHSHFSLFLLICFLGIFVVGTLISAMISESKLVEQEKRIEALENPPFNPCDEVEGPCPFDTEGWSWGPIIEDEICIIICSYENMACSTVCSESWR